MTSDTICDMSKRRPLTATEVEDALRLKAQYKSAVARAKSRGEYLTQEIVAERCGWSGQSAVSQYMNQKIPLNLSAATKLSRALGVPLSSISPSLAKESETPKLPINTSTTVAKQGRIPVVSWVNAGCWSEAVDLHEVGDAEEWILFDTHNSGDRVYALTVQGESMFDPSGPVSFSDGDIIVVDPDKAPENKSLVVVRQNGNMEATFKQLIIEGGQKMLKALNPSWPNRIMPMTEETDLCGVVIARYTKF